MVSSGLPGYQNFTLIRRFALAPHATLVVCRGDLTQFKGDAIVNAANQGMLGGGGVDGAIHRAAGPRLLADCRRVAEVAPGLRCPTGQARLTPGGDLHAKYVIHTVGPVYTAMSPENADRLLRSSYLSTLAVANASEAPPPPGSPAPPSPPAFTLPGPLETIAFPAISCGVFGFPTGRASEVAIEACRDGVGDLRQIWFVLFNDACWNEWVRAAADILE